MSLLRVLGRLSALEWALLGLLVYGLARWRGPSSRSGASQPASLRRAIDACALLAVAGLLAGALLDVYWLSLAGVVAAAAGIGLALRQAGAGLRGWLARLIGRNK